jgi:alanyl-tRNA synthetase
MTAYTERLFWSDPDLSEFEATVTAVRDRDGDAAVALDRTALYPESGGQPCDRGELAGLPVADVREEEGDIWHVVPAGRFSVGDPVRGRVDMDRRRDHSCQHTAQHIVSALALGLLGARTIGFHMGELCSTVDLDMAELSAADRARLELAANRAVAEDLPVTAEVSLIEPGMALRARQDPTPGLERRLVSIGDLDRCQCCGTHVRSSALVGAIKLGKVERVRRKVRLELFAGGRVLAELERLMTLVDELTALTSAGPSELAGFIAAAEQTTRALKRRCGELASRLAAVEARELLNSAEDLGGRSVVKAIVSPRDPGELKILAAELTAVEGTIALLGTVFEGSPALVFARSADVEADVAACLKAAIAILGGGGGGRPQLAQGGGGDPAKLEEALDAAALDVR